MDRDTGTNNGDASDKTTDGWGPADWYQMDPSSLEAVRRESRIVLDHQIDTINDISRNALWLVRTSVLFLSVIVSGAAITASQLGKDEFQPIEEHFAGIIVGVLGLCLLLFVIAFGTLFFAAARFPVGANEAFRRPPALKNTPEEEIQFALLRGYDTWIPQARREANRIAYLISYLQFAFTAGVLVTSLGISLLVLSLVFSISQIPLLAFGSTICLIVFLFISPILDRIRYGSEFFRSGG